MKTKAYLVEDEPNARNLLRGFIEKYTDLNVIGESDRFDLAVRELNLLAPEIVFLDVSLPGKSGIDILHEMKTPEFEVIFVTAHEEYALRALKLDATDYLLKPIDIQELKEAVLKAKKRIELKQAGKKNTMKEGGAKKVFISYGSETLVLEKNDIIRFEANGRYTILYLAAEKKYTLTRNLGEFEKEDVFSDFLRLHHSHLVNPVHIRSYVKTEGGSVQMSDGSTVYVSRRNKEVLKQFLKDGGG